MSMRVRTASFGAALVLVTAALAAAKPPGLPVEEKDKCKEHSAGKLPYDPPAAAAAPGDPAEESSARADEAAEVIDGFCAVVEPLLLRLYTHPVIAALDDWLTSLAHVFDADGTQPAAGNSSTETYILTEIGEGCLDEELFPVTVKRVRITIHVEDGPAAGEACEDCPVCGKLCDCCSWMREVVRICWKGLKEGVIESITAKSPPPRESQCPYLRQKEAEKSAVEEPAELSDSIFENLDRLEEAQVLCRRAERCLRRSRSDLASLYYEKVKYLCPGSRFDQAATYRLQEIYAVTTARGTTGEEAEAKPKLVHKTFPVGGAGPNAAGASNGKCVEEQVAELLEECQRAYAAGHYKKAARLARKALALDPECVAARALVAKTQKE